MAMSAYVTKVALAAAALALMHAASAQPPASGDAPSASSSRDLHGMWEPTRFHVLTDAPLNAAGEALVQRNRAAMDSGRIMHTAWTSCRPGAISSMTMPRELIMIMQTPREVVILYEMPRMIRRIELDGTHPNDIEPSYVGHSVGRWEGDTLVVESIGFNGYGELDAHGKPTSTRLRTVERFTKSADGERLDIEITIDDPEYYTEPFTIHRSWRRAEARHQHEYDCMENPRQEDFANAYYVHDRYRPTCMRVQGEGMEPSRMVCRREEQ
nr:hypothetical protein [Gammaproteobacteria bacterium]